MAAIFHSPRPPVRIPNEPITDVVLRAAQAHPERPALVDATTGRTLTFGGLVDQVRRVAAGLAAVGIGKGDVVALWSPNAPEFAVAFHAVARLGGVITTANPASTSHELALQLVDAGATLLITTGDLLDRARAAVAASGRSIDLITLDDAAGVRSLAAIACDAEPPAVAIDPVTDVVALPYSSGTTGLPKGVMLTHRNLVANLVQIDDCEREDLRAIAGVLPFFHIYGMNVIMNFGLMRGATIVTLPRFELEPFLQLLQDWPIALAHIVPPIAVALAKHPVVDRYDLRHVRCVFSGAAPFGPELTRALRERLQMSTRQGYGLTETSPAAYYTPAGTERDGKVGILVANTECRIVSVETGLDAAPGEAGEVWIRGPQVMRGYLNNPDATAATIDADGWLHSGDIGTVDDEGYLTVVDRLKELIKVKGFQVAPAELESMLLKHPQIADAAVIPVPDDDAGELPKAIVVARGPLTAEDVTEFVRPHVAPYKRIRYVEFVESIPKSPSGKILRRVLVARERSGAAGT
jgi:acyl-CoA synthetase (AMP-forming)/AMP-acid ligase II